MKRLCEKQQDPYLGKPIEIINTDSKLYAFRGVVNKIHNNKYTLKIDPEKYENTDKPHWLYIPVDKMYKWVRILPQEGE